jgi:hypothetical protein
LAAAHSKIQNAEAKKGEEGGTSFLRVERLRAGVLEAVRVVCSIRTYQERLFVLVLRDIKDQDCLDCVPDVPIVPALRFVPDD